jgi:HAD superfamily hydrolase (TIGR01450 family)
MAFDFSKYPAVLLDLDGTIYYENHPLPGAIELIRRLQAERRNYACISNSTTSPHRVTKRLLKMGVEVEEDRVYTAAAAAAHYALDCFKDKGRKVRVYNLATDGLQELLEGSVEWARSDAEPCDAVIIGAPANAFATPDRQRAALKLLRNGALAIGICSDRVYPSERGLEFGSGALSRMLGFAAAVDPVFCGKPQEIFFRDLCRRLAVETAGCLLIGDNLESDVMGGKALGMRTILTLTGVAHREDLKTLKPELQPDWVVENLTELL